MAKGLAIVCVVLGHCLSDTTGLRALVYSFHMPLFFMLAGFTMRPKPRRTVLVQSFKRLLVPYFLVCAILLLFAIVPPDSINPNLDSQRSFPVVLVEIFYGSGQEGVIYGHTFQAIGAIWFLPCLFWARLLLNEVLLHTDRLSGPKRLVEPLAVALIVWLGMAIGKQLRLPFDLDTALVAAGFLYVGLLVKRRGFENIRPWQWTGLLVIWLFYSWAGNNEMAVRAYLENPWSLVTAAAGSLVIMKCCQSFECVHPARKPIAFVFSKLKGLFAWAGVSSLLILCVHRVESAVFNWQKIMETFAPGVWDWDILSQGLYQFALRVALVLLLTAAIQWAVGRMKALASARDLRS